MRINIYKIKIINHKYHDLHLGKVTLGSKLTNNLFIIGLLFKIKYGVVNNNKIIKIYNKLINRIFFNQITINLLTFYKII